MAKKQPAKKPPAGKPPAKPQPLKKPPAAAKPVTAKPVTAKPVAAKPVAKQPPTKQPPAKQPPAKQPPAKQPPAKQPALPVPGAQSTTSTSSPPPGKAIDFRLLTMSATGDTAAYDQDTQALSISPPDWFAVEPTPPTPRRWLHLVQLEPEDGDGFIMLQAQDGASAPRLPADAGWLRAIVDGKLRLIAADRLLTRADIARVLGGGHTGKPTPTEPPYT